LPGTVPTARLLLKGRPTDTQLADRLADPLPDGLELYLDLDDIRDSTRLAPMAERLAEQRPHRDFVYVVEGPIRSLDGSYFDISVDSEANRECLKRVVWVAAAIGAEAVLIHAITPMPLGTALSEGLRKAKLEESLPLVERYVHLAMEKGVVPLMENIPPVARQRQAAYMVTPVGMSARDLAFFADRFPGLGVTIDLSHAGLFLNGLRMDPAAVEPALAPLVTYLRGMDDSSVMGDYLSTVAPYLFEIHVSNARGLLEEGLPYGEGDLDLDTIIRPIAPTVRYLVTETLEPDPDRAVWMRDAQRRLESILSDVRGAPLPPLPLVSHEPDHHARSRSSDGSPLPETARGEIASRGSL